MSLHTILGSSIGTPAQYAVDAATGYIAYAAGGITVLYDPKRNKQIAYFFDTSTPAPTTLTRHVPPAANKAKTQAKRVSCLDIIWEETQKGDRTLVAIGKVISLLFPHMNQEKTVA